jgi:hypothetical protein
MGWLATAARSAARGIAATAVLLAGLAPVAAAETPDSSAVTPDSTAAAPAQPAPPAVPRATAEWETLATGLPEQVRVGLLIEFVYNRVDGPAPQVGVALRRERDPAPLLYVKGGYAFSRERSLGSAGFELPLGDRSGVRVGGDVYRRTASEDEWIVGSNENTIFALLARTDYRDWYEAQGIGGRAIWEPGTDAALEARVTFEDQSSLRTNTRVSAFGREPRFRENPAIDSGTEGLLAVAARLGPLVLPKEGGSRVTLRYERAGGPLGRDFDYGRFRATVNGSRRVGKRASGRARIVAGSTREGTLPSQKIWHLGGIGTLRGHEYKAFAGDQFLLANGEGYWKLRKNVFGMAFLDWGAAWFGAGNLDRQRPALDGGIGIRLFEEPGIALTAARDLQRDNAPILVGFRLGAAF